MHLLREGKYLATGLNVHLILNILQGKKSWAIFCKHLILRFFYSLICKGNFDHRACNNNRINNFIIDNSKLSQLQTKQVKHHKTYMYMTVRLSTV